MSDVRPRATDAPARSAPPRAAGLLHSGIFADPLVRNMTYAASVLVILFLATVVGALATGVLSPTGPRTAAEQQVVVTAAGLQKGAVGETWAPYINALMAAGDVRGARAALAQARAGSVATSPLPDLDLAEARILRVENRPKEAADAAAKAMKGYEAEHDARVAKAGATATVVPKISAAYYEAALVRAYAYVDQGRFKDAVPMFDLYIQVTPTASDIFVDRGNAKVELKDIAGAEKDFRQALKYVPYDEEAKAGLKRIGVAK